MSRNLLGIRHIPAEDLRALIALGQEFKKRVIEKAPLPRLSDETVGLLFFEDSTRTRVSFEQAAKYLGMNTVSFTGRGSSMSKGESLKDTILTLRHERLTTVVMRHKMPGAAQLAARYFPGPVLNAGDGEHEHPAQALGDALTILEHKGQIEGLIVAIVGDVEHSRVARSNAWLLSKLGAVVRFVGPKTMLPSHTAMLPGSVHYTLDTGIHNADVVMCLRLQKERMLDGLLSSTGEYARMYQVTRQSLEYAAPDCLVMHPGPLNRGIELDDDSADGDRSVISEQVENGIYVRMAAYWWAVDKSIDDLRAMSGKVIA